MSIFDSRFSSANMILSGCSSVKLDHTPAMDASGFVQQCLIMGRFVFTLHKDFELPTSKYFTLVNHTFIYTSYLVNFRASFSMESRQINSTRSLFQVARIFIVTS